MNHATTTRIRRSAISDDYLALICEFPIRPLKTAKDYRSAMAILDRLIGREDLSTGQVDYLAALVRFVEDYERKQHMGEMEQLTPLELLTFLMEENDMNTSDLGKILGSRGLASEVLNGKRGLSKTLIRRLADRFKVEAGLFLDKA